MVQLDDCKTCAHMAEHDYEKYCTHKANYALDGFVYKKCEYIRTPYTVCGMYKPTLWIRLKKLFT